MYLNFYLREKDTDKETNLLLSFIYSKKRLLWNTGIKLKQKQWNSAKHYVYGGGRNARILNDKIKKIKEVATTEYEKELILGNVPETGYFKEILDHKIKGKKKKVKIEEKQPTFYDYYIEMIKHKQKFVKDNTIQKFDTLLSHLKKIEKKYNIELSLNSFTKSFYYQFVEYFVGLGQLNRTIKEKHVETMNTALNWFVHMEYLDKNRFSGMKFPFKIAPTSGVALTESELLELHSFDLSNQDRLRRVRDVFCIECYTGLRYSDVHKVNKNNRHGRYLNIVTEKTIDGLKIPLRQEAATIIDSYFDNDMPLPVISNQKMNDYLKELGKLAGFNTPITVIELSGNNKVEIVKKKYELLTSHVGRRTFVTLSYQKGMRPFEIMKITGHTKYETFMKYYKLENIDVHKRFFESWEELQSKHTTIEIIKRLLTKNVSLESISYAFSIDIDTIKKSTL